MWILVKRRFSQGCGLEQGPLRLHSRRQRTLRRAIADQKGPAAFSLSRIVAAGSAGLRGAGHGVFACRRRT